MTSQRKPSLRDLPHYIRLSRHTLELRPHEAAFLNTLGVALCRNGQYSDALGLLSQSLERSSGAMDGWDLFFLAICRHRLGQATQAQADLQSGVNWLEQHTELTPSKRAELTAFRAEAEAVIHADRTTDRSPGK